MAFQPKISKRYINDINSVFSAVKSKARGFRSVDNLIAMLYFTAGHLNQGEREDFGRERILLAWVLRGTFKPPPTFPRNC
jgi:hypothetical protein